MRVFDVYSRDYDRWYEKNKYVYLSELRAIRCAVPKKGKGLEIGVGTGRFAKPIGVSAGIDPSKNMLKIAKARGLKVFTGIGEKLPFKNEEYDYVLMVITLCFVKNADKVILEAGRVLKNNGKMIIGIVDKDSFLGEVYQEKKKNKEKFYKDVNLFSAGEVIELLKKHDFKSITAFQTLFNPLEKIKKVEVPKKGFGKGGFAVICGKKN
jgi:ubiquinone/menaquinone biosynthesis C-methylase UbiE